MSHDDDRDGRPTSTAVPRPRKLEAVKAEPTSEPPGSDPAGSEPPVDVVLSTPPPSVEPPDNPTLRDIYRLIDARFSPQIVERISKLPPPPRVPSLRVRATRATGRWTLWSTAAIGILTLVGQGVAWVEQYRGPITQALTIIARTMDQAEAAKPPALEPEPPPARSFERAE